MAATDPLAPLVTLPGVADAGEAAREALALAHRHMTNRRGWPASAAEAAMRAARATSVLDGASLVVPTDGEPDAVVAGALRVAEALEGEARTLVGVWRHAPLQAIARLHSLAAVGLTTDERLGRPRAVASVGKRMELLADVVMTTRVPAPVLAGVVHGELLTLRPFGVADGVVARAVSRLVCIASGLDTHGLGVPETFWMRKVGDYRAAAKGFESGTPEGLATWLVVCSNGLKAGAREALSIAEAAQK